MSTYFKFAGFCVALQEAKDSSLPGSTEFYMEVYCTWTGHL